MFKRCLSVFGITIFTTAALLMGGGAAQAQRGGGGHGGGGHAGGGHVGGAAHVGGVRVGGASVGGVRVGGASVGGVRVVGAQVGGVRVVGTTAGFGGVRGVAFGGGLFRPYYGFGFGGLGYGGFGGYGGYGGGYGGYGGYAPYYGGGIAAASYGAPGIDPNYAMPAGGAQPDAQADNAVHLQFKVPEGAEVWFDGTKTQQTGPVREFTSPPLPTGRRYTYMISVRSKDANGKEIVDTRPIHVRANDWFSIDFTRPAPAEQIPLPKTPAPPGKDS